MVLAQFRDGRAKELGISRIGILGSLLNQESG